ncbi:MULTISPECIES: SRPBCC domain-containing protein [unclassified Streptomyces]|uniref:SRPBCC domain-containing protein n=1 Tax=unclassified Streptomyces TaxID=2593676 RepID=UPI001660434A|nr:MULTISPECIES: SRPBCC domain-containing protein [unclassified Streptomyces]MBD0710369.1 polyketide cyclase [Streptomyces sp. CBMA291]MBD0712704.1 polyketide cyclase [Streptomyces sp. CBMA370]
MYSTRVSRHVAAPPSAVYRALVDPAAVARWRVPYGMTCEVHEFDAREGGTFRVSLTYEGEDGGTGGSGGRTDTYHGRFAELLSDERVVEVVEFETEDPGLRGAMSLTTTLVPMEGGTDVILFHEGIPDAVPAADNELGTRMALDRLAALAEGRPEEEVRS